MLFITCSNHMHNSTRVVEQEARNCVEPYFESSFADGVFVPKLVKLKVSRRQFLVGLSMQAAKAKLTTFSNMLQIEVPIGRKLFLDELLWDAADPQNTPEGYASSMSSALGLGWDDAQRIRQAVHEQLKVQQACAAPALHALGRAACLLHVQHSLRKVAAIV